MGKDMFVTDDFLLENRTASRLYHEYARALPIIDFHTRCRVQQIADDCRFRNMTHLWLYDDPGKWRLMRECGIGEDLCTGTAGDWEKFLAFSKAVENAVLSPLHHTTHMELKFPFGISDRLLTADTAQSVWDGCNGMLDDPGFSARGLLRQFNVRLLCTVDDPIDSLEHHVRIRQDTSFPIRVLPTFRLDTAYAVDTPRVFTPWVASLANAAEMEIHSFGDFIDAIKKRHDFFHQHGCRISRHDIDLSCAEECSQGGIDILFEKARHGPSLSPGEIRAFRSALLHETAALDHEKGWVRVLLLNIMRDVNSGMRERAGPGTGFFSIGDAGIVQPLMHFLDRCERKNRLPKTVICSGNPGDTACIAGLAGAFPQENTTGRIRFGNSGFPFQGIAAIESQLEGMSSTGLLSSMAVAGWGAPCFTSFSRHEYFRRILCNFLGKAVEKGTAPADMNLIGTLVQDICSRNVLSFFRLRDDM